MIECTLTQCNHSTHSINNSAIPSSLYAVYPTQCRSTVIGGSKDWSDSLTSDYSHSLDGSECWLKSNSIETLHHLNALNPLSPLIHSI